jgi:hypothetical protein
MVWLVLILVGVVCVFLVVVRHWQFRFGEERTIGGSLWQLPLWFAVGAVPTYLLGVICATLKGWGAWQGVEAIAGGVLAGFGVMAYIAAPLVDLALGASRWRAFHPPIRGSGGTLLLVAIGLFWATLPLWWPNHLAGLVTPEMRQVIVKRLQSPDESTRREAADLLWDVGMPDDIPALEAALKKAKLSGDRELEQKCNRTLERLQRR